MKIELSTFYLKPIFSSLYFFFFFSNFSSIARILLLVPFVKAYHSYFVTILSIF